MEKLVPNRRAFLRSALGAVLGALVTSSCQKRESAEDSPEQSKQAAPSSQKI